MTNTTIEIRTKDAAPRDEQPMPADNISVTRHTTTIGGQAIDYTVTAGTIVLREESETQGEDAGASEGEKPKAAIFFVAYTRDGVDDPSIRPLTFLFNR